jgi:hypothetical protein
MERFSKKLPDRLVAHLKLLGGDFGGFPVDRLEHCLQTATRAYQAGRDEEYVVCALFETMDGRPANEDDWACGDWSPGRFAWLLERPIKLPQPISAKGKQGWWRYDLPATPVAVGG